MPGRRWRRWRAPTRTIPIRAAGRSAAWRLPPHVKLGVPRPGQRLFFGDRQAPRHYDAALERLARLGCALVEIDIEPFYETARLLYEGPWVAERTLTARSLSPRTRTRFIR